MVPPQIILLNGTSSSGKTSLAKALQAASPVPLFHVCIDAFEEMMPPAQPKNGHFRFLTGALTAMYGTISALASSGNHMVVDHVLIENEEPRLWIPGYQSAVEPFRVMNVKVFAPLDVLRRREAARLDRPIGLAEWQSSRMHRSFTYDLEIDTSKVNPEEGARSVLNLAFPGSSAS